ncbi:MAG: hypothetical protein EXS64_12290 [Candidatus Latescibacteria bacterium]|nr:hypothetical protein [Candidatus Latescibacterota bacterium]
MRGDGPTLPERIQEGIGGGLDWIVAFYPMRAGAFMGLSDVQKSYETEDRGITAILGIGGETGKGVWSEGVAFGVDPQSPVPTDSLQAAIDWAESHRGVFIFSRTEGRLEELCGRWQGGTAFIGLRGTHWSADCGIGGAWDRLLKGGRRLFVVGTQETHPPGKGSKTYVWAKGDDPSEIVEGLRRGGIFVSEQDGIRMDLRVNGGGMGASVPVEGTVNIRLLAATRHPISRVALVCDGRVIWEATPDSTMVEERLRLPIGDEGYTYLRPIVESRAGGYCALGNPVFLIPGESEGVSEGSPVSGGADTFYPAVEGALETASALAPGPRRTVLSTLLREVRTRTFAVQALRNRTDLISDDVLEDLLDDRDPAVRLGAAYACVMRGGEGLSETLLGLLLDRDAAVRSYAARMIFQSHIPIPAGSLLSFLSDRDPVVRLHLAGAVDDLSDDPNVINKLVEMMDDPDADVSDAASEKLVRLGGRSYGAVAVLLKALRSGSGKVADLIGEVGDRRVLPDLEEVYTGAPYGDLKRRCFLALDRLGAPYLDRKRITVRRTASPPRIDGLLSPGEWEGATPLEGLGSDHDGVPSSGPFTGRLMCDDRAIYVLWSRPILRADEGVKRLSSRDDPMVWKEDRLEISFDPAGDRKGRRTFVVSAAGAQFEVRDGYAAWDVSWAAAVGRAGKVWSVECAIPLQSLDLDASGQARTVGFNLSWVDVVPSSRISWSITYGAPENPARFGDLVLTE